MNTTIHCQLPSMALTNKRVLLRIDGNAPIVDGIIADDYRLQAIRPTLDFLLKQKAHVLLVTHIGRPKVPTPALSTTILVKWLNAHAYQAVFAQTISQAADLLTNHDLVVLENIRFWPEETAADLSFAQQLKTLTDVYVNDAFGTMHRADTSITILAQQYAHDQRTIGFLVEKELRTLNRLLNNPARPFVAFIGGAKLETKLPLIAQLLQHADAIALLPALSTTFAYVHDLPIGVSLYSEDYLAQARAIEHEAHALKKKLIFPTDYLVAHKQFAGPYRYCAATAVTPDDLIISIGPQTVTTYQHLMNQAQTIFCNGSAGDLAYPQTIQPMVSLMQNLCKSTALRVVAGGDSASIINHKKLTTCVDLLSTGGGATLQYLCDKPLVGLQPFIY